MLKSDPIAWTRLELLNSNSLYRRVTLEAAMCGPNSLFVGQLGDWTWETVSALCETNVFKAKNPSGAPTYLAFYYIHIKASPNIYVSRFSFGDEIEIVSSAFNFGSESVLTLHRISMASEVKTSSQPIDPEEFYDRPEADCIYVETFNRWI